MTILTKIENQWLSYVSETGREPKYLFLGDKELSELDSKTGIICFRYKNMDVISVSKISWLSVGNKYQEG